MTNNIIKRLEELLEYYESRVDGFNARHDGICIQLYYYVKFDKLTEKESNIIHDYLWDNRSTKSVVYYFKDNLERMEVIKRMIKEFKEKISCC
jgi:hypothetical protein